MPSDTSQCNCVNPALTPDPSLHPRPSALQEGDCEVDLELEGEVEDVCEAEEEEEEEEYLIDEELPGASAAQVLVLEDGPYLIEDVEASSTVGRWYYFFIYQILDLAVRFNL